MQFAVTFHLNWFRGICVCFVLLFFPQVIFKPKMAVLSVIANTNQSSVFPAAVADELLAALHTDTVSSLAIS